MKWQVINFAAKFATLLTCIAAAYGSCTHGAVRLVGGTTTNQGRVEVCVGQTWGTVCQYGFYSNDAKVVCRQLGYNVDQPGASVGVRNYAYYGQGSGPIWLRNVLCKGTEQQLLQCANDDYSIGATSCSHSSDVGVICPSTPCVNGNVRLIGGLVPTEGTVQMCVGGRWRELCYNNWGYQEAFVVCRQLGLPATAAVATSGTNFSPRSLQSLYSNFRCYGNESSPMNCLYSSSSCTVTYYYRRDAAVKCLGDIADSCLHNGSIRLVGPSDPNTVGGRVEYCSNGVWGTISSSGFDTRDGEVVCRQLGHQNPRVQLFSSNIFGRGTGPVLFTDLSCTGTEYSPVDCPHTSQPYSSHYNDIGVRCLLKVLTSCTNGAVRLMNGSTSDEGRVEVCVNGEWGTVCDSGWDRSEAEVVCKQLGYNPSWAIFHRSSRFGDGTLPILVQSYSCTGTESSLTSCSGGTTGYSTCYYGRVAGVRCFRSTGCVNGTVRLVNGRRASEGSVQICVNGVWGHVCGYYWYPSNAKVVCRQLGYSTTVYSASDSLFSGGSPQPIIYGRISCSSTQQALSACSKYVYYSSSCPITRTGGVVCEVPNNCTSGDVRLVNGSSDSEGIVEVCYQGVWTTVAGNSYYWDYHDARVLCRQLGYHDKWAVAIGKSYFNDRIVYRYHCSGNEASLQSCLKNTYSSSYYAEHWHNRPRAAVECQQMSINLTITCTMEGATRLVNGSNEREGRVEVCQDGYWGTVCSDSWTEEDAYVVCRQTGLNTIRAIAITDGRYGKGVGPVHMSSVSCDGHEMRLENCGHSNGVGVTNCHHGRDAGVLCEEAPTHYDVSIKEVQEPYSIGSKNTIHCNVSPKPHLPVTYQWRTTATGVILSDTSAVSPNATVVIQPSATKYVYCYCIVKQTGTTIGTGVIRIDINNILQPAVPVPLMATTGSDITLRVSVTETDRNTYLRELTWYYNGVKINPTSNTRLNLTSDNTSLTISSVTDSDSGQYSVQYDGLRLYPYDSGCERQALDLFRHYPLLAPAVLYLSTGNVAETLVPVLSANVSHKNLFNGTSSNVELLVNTATDDYLDVPDHWFHNGVLLPTTARTTILTQQAKLTLDNPFTLDIGVYETQLRINTHSKLTCDNPSPYTGFMGTSTAIIRSDVQQLLYYETPFTEFTAESSSLPATHTTTLTCTATGGYPPVDSITLYKNNELIMRTSSGALQYNTTTSSQYGRYECAVDSKIHTIWKALLLQEEEHLTIIFQVQDCSMWTRSRLKEFETALSGFIGEIPEQPASTLFINSSLSCSSSSLTFSSTLTYSSEDGSLTATDLINRINSQLTSETGATISVGGVQLQVSSNSGTSTMSSLLVGLFLGGFGSSTLIWVIVIIIIVLVIFKCRRGKQYNLDTTSTEARYCSSAQAVTLSKAPQTTPAPKQHQPPTSRPPPPLKPKKKQQQTAPPKAAPPKAPPSMLWDNPSYGYTNRDDPEMYEELDVKVSNEEEYGGEYECI